MLGVCVCVQGHGTTHYLNNSVTKTELQQEGAGLASPAEAGALCHSWSSQFFVHVDTLWEVAGEEGLDFW